VRVSWPRSPASRWSYRGAAAPLRSPARPIACGVFDPHVNRNTATRASSSAMR
jgi:hypothetical protein